MDNQAVYVEFVVRLNEPFHLTGFDVRATEEDITAFK
jgi:hypothetical protein